ncbi:hypothetical protein AVEN_208722-1 [Araneus ventricosus]|uniref:Uncharacterized protein n=1 Tax=Araneus ventricosus TaxID=182803 RepID=A0A4Y2VQW2_ARAVE|nr:hypothetical protein AVEN_208722-1 [Araneus ventricosus]
MTSAPRTQILDSPRSSIPADRSPNDDCYNWVFDPLANGNVKVICDTVETSSESTSATEDSVFTEDNSTTTKSILSIKER